MPPDSFPLFAAPSCLGQQGFPPWGISCTLQTFSQSTCLWNQAAFPSFSWVKGFPTLILAHSLITHCFPVGSLPENSSSHWLTSAVGTTSLPGPARFLSRSACPTLCWERSSWEGDSHHKAGRRLQASLPSLVFGLNFRPSPCSGPCTYLFLSL